jgi:hypothetical protein
MKQGNLKRLTYKSQGQQLQQDIMAAIVEVEGEEYTHPIPNVDWGYQTASLQLIGYLGLKPSDFEGGSVDVDCTVPVDWSPEHGEYLIDDEIFMQGVQALSDTEWFSEEGTIWNSGDVHAFGGMNVEPGTGNQGAVEIETEG